MTISTDQVCAVLSRLARAVDSPRGIMVRLLADHHEWEQLQQLPPVNPGDYQCSESYLADAMVTDFARKSPPVRGDLHETALKSFWECEAQNLRTNGRLTRYIGNQGPFEPSDMRVLHFIDAWRKNVKRLLGPLPNRLNLRFSPGATLSNKGSSITIPDKLSTGPMIYPGMSCLMQFIDETAWGRLHLTSPQFSIGNHFFSVPKDSKKNRGCCKEASGAVVLQLAAGGLIRTRLKRRGIDLDNGQDVHRKLALQASRDGSLATIDMSNASDTVSYLLVKLLLPDEWFQLLDSLRAPFTQVEGKWVRLEKFSSMGNGFTFELETLIFFTLAETLAEETGTFGTVKCYGDDLIVPSCRQYLSDLLAALAFFGFTPNVQKTYLEGAFRESCGGDYFNGVRVRSHFQKNYLEDPQQWMALHNGLTRIDRPSLTGEARRYVFSQIPRHIRRCRGPAVLGDSVIHTEDVAKWQTRSSPEGWDGLYVRAWLPVPRRLPLRRWTPDVVYASALYGVPSDGVSPRGQVKGHKDSWLWVPRALLSS